MAATPLEGYEVELLVHPKDAHQTKLGEGPSWDPKHRILYWYALFFLLFLSCSAFHAHSMHVCTLDSQGGLLL